MRKTIYLTIFILSFLQAKSQISLQSKVDTTDKETSQIFQFIRSYFQKDTITHEFWHPKYKNKETYDYTMDWFFGKKSPGKLNKYYDLEVVELQKINDTLHYFKILAKSKKDVVKEDFSNVFKYYVVKIKNRLYLDNCKDYDSKRFKKFEFANINFYISPFYSIDKNRLKIANNQLEKLYKNLKKPKLKKKIDYFMCSSEEELNNLSNIIIWNGGLTGYTNIPEGFIVGINNNPVYNHEFVHAILGTGANCFFLQEGVATLYGGLNKGDISYEKALLDLKTCFKSGKCTFENLLKRQVDSQFNSNLTYTFAAVFCKYIIDKYGLNYFYKIYYNKEVTTDNFLKYLCKILKKDQKEIKIDVEQIIMK